MAPRWHTLGAEQRRELGVTGIEQARTVPHPYTPEGHPLCVTCSLPRDADVHQMPGER